MIAIGSLTPAFYKRQIIAMCIYFLQQVKLLWIFGCIYYSYPFCGIAHNIKISKEADMIEWDEWMTDKIFGSQQTCFLSAKGYKQHRIMLWMGSEVAGKVQHHRGAACVIACSRQNGPAAHQAQVIVMGCKNNKTIFHLSGNASYYILAFGSREKFGMYIRISFP